MRNSTLRPYTPKRAKQNLEYEKAKRIWRSTHDGRCEFVRASNGQPLPWKTPILNGVIRCTHQAMPQPHHVKFRGPNLCNIEFFMAACFDCHNWITAHGKEAEILGYVIREYAKH